MKSVISEIFDGESYRTENIKRSKKYKQLQKTADIVYQRFTDTLNGKQAVMFEEVYNSIIALEAEQSKTSFEDGFKLGLLVAFEAVNG